MRLLSVIDSWAVTLRPAFSREASFRWFVLVLWGLSLRVEGEGATSIIRCLGLTGADYPGLLHFFHSSAFHVKTLCHHWLALVHRVAPAMRVAGRRVYLFDGLKVGKAGHKMPGVKTMHQESGNTNKPEFFMGHYWGALTLLVGNDNQLFALPIRFQLQDGLKRSPSEKATLPQKMCLLATETVKEAALFVGDRYFACKKVLAGLVTAGHHFIGAVRINSVAYLPPPPRPPGTRGRPRKYGDKVVLVELFKSLDLFQTTEVCLYGELQKVHYLSVDLWWLGMWVRFVLSINEQGRRGIFVSTDVTLDPVTILRTYGFRFRIEEGFKVLIHTLLGMNYRFWMKAMEKVKRGGGDQYLHRAGERYRAAVARKVEAYERFVNIAGMAMGMLQVLALTVPEAAGAGGLYFRTMPRSQVPSVRQVQLTLQGEVFRFFRRNEGTSLLAKILTRHERADVTDHPHQLAA